MHAPRMLTTMSALCAVFVLNACYPERPYIRLWGGDKAAKEESAKRRPAAEQPTIVTGAEGDIASANESVISSEPVPGMPETQPMPQAPASTSATATAIDPSTQAPMPQAPAGAAESLPSSSAGADMPQGDSMASLPTPPAGQVLTLQADAAFGFNSSDLSPEGRQKLDELAGKLAGMDRSQLSNVTVIGHADRLGPSGGNQALSERRALAVKSYLADQGVDPGIIQTEGRGSSEPVVTCSGNRATEKLKNCLAPNRRVEVLVNANR
jgi:outer membrane protein OmpA-like peptidoglycan-associated protein